MTLVDEAIFFVNNLIKRINMTYHSMFLHDRYTSEVETAYSYREPEFILVVFVLINL